jgi:hypothetical protein
MTPEQLSAKSLLDRGGAIRQVTLDTPSDIAYGLVILSSKTPQVIGFPELRDSKRIKVTIIVEPVRKSAKKRSKE